MSSILFIITIITCLVVLIILMFGIGSFAKGGNFGKKYSNKLMRWRIIAQAVAVLLIIAFVYFEKRVKWLFLIKYIQKGEMTERQNLVMEKGLKNFLKGLLRMEQWMNLIH